MQGFVHINFSDLDMIRTAFTDEATNKFGYKMIGKKEFVMNDVFVEGQEFLLITGIVGGEEVEVEEVVMNRDIEYKADAAHGFEL